MAQALSDWQQVIHHMQRSATARRSLRPEGKSRLHRRAHRRLSAPGVWLVGVSAVAGMGYWDWKLLLATLAGGGMMLLAYRMQRWDWQRFWLSLNRSLQGSQWQFTLAAGSGGVAALTAYLAAAVWADSTSPWIGASIILQGCGTLTVLALLVWQALSRQSRHAELTLEREMANLTESDSLKRLIAVRQLSRMVSQRQLEPGQTSTLGECFRLMVAQEQEPVVKDALLDGLQVLSDAETTHRQPIAISLTGHSGAKPRRRSLRESR